MSLADQLRLMVLTDAPLLKGRDPVDACRAAVRGGATAVQVRQKDASPRDLATLASCMRKFPQVLVNVPVRSKPPFDSVSGLGERVQRFEEEMNGAGRILIRYSGTEPVARIMIEGADEGRIRAMADELAGVVRGHIGVG